MIPVSRPSISDEELLIVKQVFDTAWLGHGSFVEEFESAIKSYLGCKNVIAVNSGTSAIHLALEVAGIGSGDEVIVPSFTFGATIQPIIALGARPVFCDILEDTLNLDPRHTEKLVSKRTRAILPVHYMGAPSNMDSILNIASKYQLAVIEDAAHAFGSKYKGRFLGSSGDLTCFSFDPIKNITCGEGGAITTSNDELASLLKKKRKLGIDPDSVLKSKNGTNWEYEINAPGYRYHLSNINAAIGIVQLKKADEFRNRKIEVVEYYNEEFEKIQALKLLSFDPAESFPFGFTMRVCNNKRDEFRTFLKSFDIETSINYIPNHFQPLFKDDTFLPITEKIFEEIVSLPLFASITDNEVNKVVSTVKAFFSK